MCWHCHRFWISFEFAVRPISPSRQSMCLKGQTSLRPSCVSRPYYHILQCSVSLGQLCSKAMWCISLTTKDEHAGKEETQLKSPESVCVWIIDVLLLVVAFKSKLLACMLVVPVYVPMYVPVCVCVLMFWLLIMSAHAYEFVPFLISCMPNHTTVSWHLRVSE